MAILTPLAVPLGLELVGLSIVPVLIGVLFGGAIWGDHSSPISDTTVMSSIFAGSDHIDHVNTQVPFAGTAAGATLVGLLLYGVGVQTAYVVLPLAFVLTAGAVVALNKLDARRKGLPEVMPSAEEIESGNVDPDAIENGEINGNNGSHDYLSTVPILAIIVVSGYLALLVAFATLGG
jgi:hypothetical protein